MVDWNTGITMQLTLFGSIASGPEAKRGRLVSHSKKAGKIGTKGPTLAEFNYGTINQGRRLFPSLLKRYSDTHSLMSF